MTDNELPMKIFAKLLMLASLAALGIGCGGGGGAGTLGASNDVGVYVTDAPGSYAHAWITVKQVDLVGPSGTTTAYSDATGQTVDLVALNQAGQQQFALLGVSKVPAGTYKQVKITVDQNIVLVPAGATSGTTYTFADSNGGVKVLSFSTDGSTATSLVIDFDLGSFKIVNGQVAGVVRPGDPGKIDPNHEPEQQFNGLVTNLAGTAPNLTFDLQQGEWFIHVSVSAATALSNDDGSANPTLANGAKVHVRGSFNSTSKSLAATSIVIATTTTVRPMAAAGVVSAVGTSSFKLDTMDADGFKPTSSSVTVNTSATTHFFHEGVTLTSADFYAALKVGMHLEVAGTYNSDGTFTADAVRLDGDGSGDGGGTTPPHGLVSVLGSVSAVHATAATFDLTVQKWFGTQLTAGETITVTVNAHTVLRNGDLSHLQNGATVEVLGDLTGTTLAATVVSLPE